MKPWEVTATPRGVECGRCGKPGQYRSGNETWRRCHDCATMVEDDAFCTVRVDTRRLTPRTLIVYANAEDVADLVERAGYTVGTIKHYTPITSKPEGRDV